MLVKLKLKTTEESNWKKMKMEVERENLRLKKAANKKCKIRVTRRMLTRTTSLRTSYKS